VETCDDATDGGCPLGGCIIVDVIPGTDGSLLVGSKLVAGKIFLRAISHFCSADNGILQVYYMQA